MNSSHQPFSLKTCFKLILYLYIICIKLPKVISSSGYFYCYWSQIVADMGSDIKTLKQDVDQLKSDKSTLKQQVDDIDARMQTLQVCWKKL